MFMLSYGYLCSVSFFSNVAIGWSMGCVGTVLVNLFSEVVSLGLVFRQDYSVPTSDAISTAFHSCENRVECTLVHVIMTN